MNDSKKYYHGDAVSIAGLLGSGVRLRNVVLSPAFPGRGRGGHEAGPGCRGRSSWASGIGLFLPLRPDADARGAPFGFMGPRRTITLFFCAAFAGSVVLGTAPNANMAVVTYSLILWALEGKKQGSSRVWVSL